MGILAKSGFAVYGWELPSGLAAAGSVAGDATGAGVGVVQMTSLGLILHVTYETGLSIGFWFEAKVATEKAAVKPKIIRRNICSEPLAMFLI